jgi:hypothetical protein
MTYNTYLILDIYNKFILNFKTLGVSNGECFYFLKKKVVFNVYFTEFQQ